MTPSRTTIARLAASSVLAVGLLGTLAAPQLDAAPEPSKFPISWELHFRHGEPRRIVIEVPGERDPRAFWYLPYTVKNLTDKEQQFLPVFTLLTKSGKLIRSDVGVPKIVFDTIKKQSRNELLQTHLQIAGTINVGEDQAKDGVAIWEEPEAEMGSFTIFVAGLSGESTILRGEDGQPLLDPAGKPIILFKTLSLDYTLSGDEVYAGIDPLSKTNQRWVMR
jgi:hypothetical protein